MYSCLSFCLGGSYDALIVNFLFVCRFEKSFSGMYLGELVRLVMVKLVDEGCLFKGNPCPELKKRWEFPTSYVTSIEE